MYVKILSLFAMALCFLALGACEDDPVVDIKGDDGPTVIIDLATEDVITTHLEGRVVLMGEQFDDVTERIIARATDVRHGEGTFYSLTAEDKYLFIDAPSLAGFMANTSARVEELNYLCHLYRNGLTICLHEPNDMHGIALYVYLHLMDFASEARENGIAAAERKFRQKVSTYSRAGKSGDDDDIYVDVNPDGDSEFGDPTASYDFWAMRHGGSALYIPDMHKPGGVYSVEMESVGADESGNEIVDNSELSVTPGEPNAFQYGLFAERAVKWLNMTKSTFASRARQAFSRADTDPDKTALITQYISASTDWSFANQSYKKWNFTCPEKTTLVMPIELNVWVEYAYNFDKDQDYYHIVLDESCDPSKVYFGRKQWDIDNEGISALGKVTSAHTAGLTLSGLTLYTRWPEPDYPVANEWNILPNKGPAPTTTETIEGWSVNADVSFNKGLSGKFSGSYTSEKVVTQIEQDVNIVTSRNQTLDSYSNWIKWNYTFANQVSFSTSKSGTKLNFVAPDSSATSVSLKSQQQSWNWVISNTSKRGDNPFRIPLKFASVSYQVANAYKVKERKYVEYYPSKRKAEFVLSHPTFYITLPVPERVRRQYTLEPEKIWNEAEYSNLMDNLTNNQNFRSLKSKLTQLDANNNVLSPTGRSLEQLEDSLGMIWYAAAKDVLSGSQHPSLSGVYRMRIRRDDGKLLNMRTMVNNRLTQVGTYLEVGPDGMGISSDSVSSYAAGTTFSINDNGGTYLVKVEDNGKDCRIISFLDVRASDFAVPASIQGLKLTGIESFAMPSAFSKTIRKLSIPGTIRTLKWNAFISLDSGLDKIEIGEGLEEVGSSCFPGAREVCFPSTFKRFNSHTFRYKRELGTVYLKSLTPPEYTGANSSDPEWMLTAQCFGSYETTKIVVPAKALEAYRKHPVWSRYKNLVSEQE